MRWIGDLGLADVNYGLLEWMNNKVLLCSAGNSYSVIKHNGKEYEKECFYVSLNHFAVQ